ncbi:hypothetical protein BV25DRAFT_1773302, partial [Artomyces pyxidatus]
IRNGGIILQFSTKEATDYIKSPAVRATFVQAVLPSGLLKDRGYSILVPFVPLTFRPDNNYDLREVEERNRLAKGSVKQARWVKPPARRDPGQVSAHTILTLCSAEAANQLLRDGLVIREKKVYPEKTKREPLRCLKCHRWGHKATECHAEHDTCGTCGKDHRTADCNAYKTYYCVSCRSTDHASWDRACPEFEKRCQQFDERYPENMMKFFPTAE